MSEKRLWEYDVQLINRDVAEKSEKLIHSNRAQSAEENRIE